MHKLISYHFLFFLCIRFCLGQGEEGVPFIKNYLPEEYNATAQNWSMVQDKRGVLYIGNLSGILEYDGTTWNKIETGGKSVRALGIDSTGKIYAGLVGGFGMLEIDSTGALSYRSLVDSLPEEHREMNDVWQVLCTKEAVFFRTKQKLFRLEDGKFSVFSHGNKSLFKALVFNNKLYMDINVEGLSLFEGDTFTYVQDTADLYIYGMIPVNDSTILIASYYKGLFLFKEGKNGKFTRQKFSSGADSLVVNRYIYNAERINKDLFSLGTLKGGVGLIDATGGLKNLINKDYGLEEEMIIHQFADREQNLWLSNSKGLSKVNTGVPFSHFGESKGLDGSVRKVLRVNDRLYAATSKGLFRLVEDAGLPYFRKIEEIKFTCWDIQSVILDDKETLLVCSEGGIYAVTDKVRLISPEFHFYSVFQFGDTPYFFAGRQEFTVLLKYFNGKLNVVEGAIDVNKSIRFFERDKYGEVWGGLNQNVIYKINFDTVTEKVNAVVLDSVKGAEIEGSCIPFYANGNIYIATKTGILSYDYEQSVLYLDTSLFGDTAPPFSGASNMALDDKGNVWIRYVMKNGSGGIGVAKRKREGHYKFDDSGFGFLKDLSVYDIFPDKNGIVWIGAQNGIVRYDSKKQSASNIDFNALVRKVVVNNDSVIFHGVYYDKAGVASLVQPDIMKKVLPFENNALTFDYAAPYFTDETKLLYQYKLEGFDPEWSTWTSATKKEYTNLSPGRYSFKVRAKNIYKNISREASYAFEILSPWYLTIWAYMGYALFLAGFFYTSIRINGHRLKVANQKLEKVVKERTREVVQQKEEIEMQKQIVEEKNRDITDSIRYAERIQKAVLPPDDLVKKLLPESFVLYLPKDIVSGDFYWMAPLNPSEGGISSHTSPPNKGQEENSPSPTNKGHNKVAQIPPSGGLRGAFFAAVDCTGHGVPGAFVSIVGHNLLNQAVNEKGITQPALILDYVNQGISKTLRQNKEEANVKDGMDIALCALDKKNMKLGFAGAFNPLYIIRSLNEPDDNLPVVMENEHYRLIEIKGDKQPIGAFIGENLKPFTNHEIKIRKGDSLYVFSDGFADQFGGKKGKKFKYKNFKKLLLSIQDRPMEKQKETLLKTFEKWRGDIQQIDDVCIIGVAL